MLSTVNLGKRMLIIKKRAPQHSSGWIPRRAHFEYFAAMANPYVGGTVNAGVGRCPGCIHGADPARSHPADSNPRISWGKYQEEGDRAPLPMTLPANHALADGIHMAHFFTHPEAEMARLAAVLRET